MYKWASLMAQQGKKSACNAGDTGDVGSIPGSGRSPEGGSGNPLWYSCHGQEPGGFSLVGYSPKGCKELDASKHKHLCISMADSFCCTVGTNTTL